MIKVYLITLQAVQNYGSVLQAYATQKLLEEKGCNVTIINYIRRDVGYDRIMETRSGGNFIKKIVLYPTVNRWHTVFEKFCTDNLNLTKQVFTSEDDLLKYTWDADAYCTGSDQVWNSKWNGGILPEFYLSFAPHGAYKFAFSASFGQEILQEEEIERTKDYISDYKYISVRERSGKSIVENQYGYPKATRLLDPTLIIEPDFWRSFGSKRLINEEYILIYNLNRSKDFDEYARKLAKKTGLKLVRLCLRYDQLYRIGKSILVPTVYDFISLIDNAKYVITDSFHATAFSMNMHTEPICIYPKEFGGRIKEFLELTDSVHRHIKNFDDFDVVNRPVDFNNVNRILGEERKKADNFLSEVIKSICI